MNESLAADLARWEQGELRADELRRLHPGAGADELLQMHARVSLATSATDELPDLGWEELEARLDLDLDVEAEHDEVVRSRRRRVPALKLVIAFVAGALVNPFQPAERAVDGMRAVARTAADAVVEEVTDVFEPMMPPGTGGVVVLDPGNTQNLSSVAPEATSDPVSSPPATGADPVPEPTPQPASEPSDPEERAPTDSAEPTEAPAEPTDSDDSQDTTAPSDPAPEPGDGSPSTPPGHQRRAERSPVHGGEKAKLSPPGHAEAAAQAKATPPGPAKAGVQVQGKAPGGPNGKADGRH